MHRLIALSSLMLVAVAGCDLWVRAQVEDALVQCDTDEDCDDGQVCSSAGVGQHCVTPCDDDDDCPEGKTCNGATALSVGSCRDVNGEA